MKTYKTLIIATILTAMTTISCKKETQQHLSSDPYTFALENISENASRTVVEGETISFDVILYYLDESTGECKKIKDDGSVTSIELTSGLENTSSFGRVRISSNASDTEIITVRLPHGYMNGTDMSDALPSKEREHP